LGKIIDLTGRQFGKWFVIEKGPFDKKKLFWKCKCDCGTEKYVDGDTLRRGTSVGCIKCSPRTIKHGMSNSKIYWVWHGMIQRCEYEKSKFYKNYGGRGIKVCEAWHDFINFYEWAIPAGYKEGVEIERIDANGNYEPSNCQWITHKQQQSNRTNNHIIEFKGISKTLEQWSEYLGVKSNTLCGRIKKYGIEKSLSVTRIGRGHKIS
jgi:hypothetical protein